MAVITLAGKDYEFDRFNIGELRRMTDVINDSTNVVERSRVLLAIAMERRYPEIKVDDDFETDLAELNAAAAVVIELAGFAMVGKMKAAPAAA